MTKGKTIALHSYKGGTGKTTLIANLAAYYAKIGLKVCLLDFDLYAPTLSMYFRKDPNLNLNDLLRGETGREVEIRDLLVDLSPELGLNGKLYLGFSSPGKEDINEIEIKHEQKWQLAAIKRFLRAKRQLFEELEIDYLFLDTSPGIRYWSINALATADLLFLIMKNSDMDIGGTKKMIADIYESLAGLGAKYFIILNKVPGALPADELRWGADEKAFESGLEKDIGTKIVGSIPCFCDIQFSKHEFLYAVNQPNHPFSKSLATLAENIRGLQ
ncbi:MAG: ParA family protein [Candidatus Bathyarchaeia archaeon]|jgi:MinD-like ATPase involved in chromosome partitioning or flagellar assembly